jgi:hypothetical protein
VVVRATAKPVCEALVAAMKTHGMPEEILTDNGKVFTGRFGPGKGIVMFDRICAENGIKHRLTAPYSPTTTGKIERFHKTLQREYLDDKVFASVTDAQAGLDAWVAKYNAEREHQSVGNRPPAARFALARTQAYEGPGQAGAKGEPKVKPRLRRRVRTNGTVSLLKINYHVGRFLAGQNVEVVLKDGLFEIFHDDVLVATHARRHPAERDTDLTRQAIAAPASRPRDVPVIIRKVDRNGSVRFAGTAYRAGNAYKHRQVEVALKGDSVQIWVEGTLVRTHPIRHDRRKEHGAFVNPSGRPDRINAA